MDAPSFTSTHSAIPARMRITKLLSVVTATAEGGTNSDGRGRLVGQETCGNIPGASRRDGLLTFSSTGIVRVFGSIELLMRARALRAMARDILAEWQLAAASPAFRDWLEAGAPSEDRGGPTSPDRRDRDDRPDGGREATDTGDPPRGSADR
jgi:hypothetical protein